MPKTKVTYTIGRTPNFDGWNIYESVRARKERWENRCTKHLTFPGSLDKKEVAKQVMHRGGNKSSIKIEYED